MTSQRRRDDPRPSTLDDGDDPVAFPAGTRITYTETTPDVDGVVWESATFAPASVVIDEEAGPVAVSLTNTGHPTAPEGPVTPEVPGNAGGVETPQGPQLPVTGFGGLGLLLAAAALVLLGLTLRRLTKVVGG
jgi:hypothetical protein